MSSVKIATKPDLREQMFEVGRAARAAAAELAEAKPAVKRAARPTSNICSRRSGLVAIFTLLIVLSR